MTGYKRKILENGARADGGFTLIEVMIVVVIIAVLAAIALPAYQQYARETKRSDAHSALLRIAALQEKFFSDNNFYAPSAVTLGYATNPATSNDGYWAITLTTAGVPATSFALSAAPAGGHLDGDCPAITYDSAGLKGPAACW